MKKFLIGGLITIISLVCVFGYCNSKTFISDTPVFKSALNKQEIFNSKEPVCVLPASHNENVKVR